MRYTVILYNFYALFFTMPLAFTAIDSCNGWETIVHQHIKKRIAECNYKNVYHFSETDKLTQYPYDDFTHYSLSLNRLLGKRIKFELSLKAEK